MRLFLLVSAICALVCLPASAQKEWNIWYFGNHAGIDFNSGTPAALEGGSLTTMEGCATVSDREGRLLFYTDGMSVWNHTHALMPNGFFLGGDTTSTQSAIIVAQPGSRTRYFVFTTAKAEAVATFGLQYSIVDMDALAGGGLGDVVEKNTALLPTAAEKVTAVRHRNGTDVWIITHEMENNVFHAYRLTPDGINTEPVLSAVGTQYEQGIGYLKASPDGTRLAAAVDFNLVEVYDFNNATGRVSNPISLRTSVPHICYGVEFSPGGRLLYAGKAFDQEDQFFNSELWQYDLAAGTPAQIQQSQITIATFSSSEASAGALQLGPGGRIYVARAMYRYVSVIADPDVRGPDCTFIDQAIDLRKAEGRYGLPNFHPAYATPEFFYSTTCFGDSTFFTIAPDLLPVDSVFWDYGDPAVSPRDTSSNPEGAHLYRAPGTYTVLLTIKRNGITEIFPRDIAISPPPAVDLGKDRLICPGSAIALDAGNEHFDSYLWSTGASSASITVGKPGVYWVAVSNGLCRVSDTVVVSLRSIPLTVGNGGAICRGESIQLSAISPEELTYRWEPAEGLNNPLVAMPVARPSTTTTYTVTATNREGCVTTATVTVVVDRPVHLELGADRTICAGGQAILNATTTGATYLWSTGETTATITATQQGVYSVVVTVGSCSAIDAVVVTVVGPALSVAGDQTMCRGGSVRLRAGGAETYEWSPAGSLDNPAVAEPVATPQETTTYRVIGTTAGCRDTAFVTVTVQENITVEFGSDTTICAGTTLQLRAPVANARYRWSTGDTTESITVSTPGLYSLTVTSGTCWGGDEIRVDVSTAAIATATSHLVICRGDTTRLVAHGATSYRWEPAAGLSDPTADSPFAFPGETTRYTVTGTNERGCTTTASVTVEIIDAVPLLLSLPDTTGTIGSANISIPLVADIDPALLPLTLRDLRVEIRIAAPAFLPGTNASGVWTTARDGGDLVITVAPGDIVLTQPRQIIAEISGVPLANNARTTALRFGRIEHGRCVMPATREGTLALDGCFPEARAVRFFTQPLLEIAPNPAGDEAVVQIHGVPHGIAHLAIHTTEGKLLIERDVVLNSSEQEVALPLHSIPSGLYRVVLVTQVGAVATMLSVIR